MEKDKDMDLRHLHGQDMQYRHGYAVWGWTGSLGMDMDMQHGYFFS
jgi:hypothetical protein